MSRKPRVWFPTATYHITARGNRKQMIFYDEKDYLRYLKLIVTCKEKIPFIIHAYCLMPNHIHLLLETIDHPPGEIIKEIHTKYAIDFNKKYDFTGHVFQGRYFSRLIHSQDYFLKVSRYIHLNPVEAEIVKDPGNYIWSSYSVFAEEGKEDPIVTTSRTLDMFQGLLEEKRNQYIQFVNKRDETMEVGKL